MVLTKYGCVKLQKLISISDGLFVKGKVWDLIFADDLRIRKMILEKA